MAKVTGAKAAGRIMIQGTSSHVGKSLLTAALLRLLKGRGLKVAPFKAQNMALNSAVCPDGGEIGRAQAFQAEAAGITPTVDMNPILLKPSADSVAQVIVRGRVYGVMTAAEYHAFKKEALSLVLESFRALEGAYDVVVVEGAGSPAEVNLRDGDLANMGFAEAVGCPVILAGDIDRGGVFASLVGTLELLSSAERSLVKGLVINKFRGDKALLKPGLDFLENRTGRKVLGVMPFLKGLALPDEDSVSLDGRGAGARGGMRVAVVRLPRISNFTDFDPLASEEGVGLDYVTDPAGIEGADLVIIPGSKDTIGDLAWMREKGLDAALKAHVQGGGHLAGICGGFQMLGGVIRDPFMVESNGLEAKGLSIFDASTTMGERKQTFQVKARATLGSGVFDVEGYEIHMGETVSNERPFAAISERNGQAAPVADGCVDATGRVWGTYIHGIFENDGFRAALLSALAGRKRPITSFSQAREAGLSALARAFEENIDMKGLEEIIGI